MVVSIGKGRGCDINRCDADRFGRADCFRAQAQEGMKKAEPVADPAFLQVGNLTIL